MHWMEYMQICYDGVGGRAVALLLACLFLDIFLEVLCALPHACRSLSHVRVSMGHYP